jgi:hypothetical protein
MVRPSSFVASARALTLLKEWLSPEQRVCYERFRHFDVVGSDTGRRYRLHYGTQTSVEEATRDNVSADGASFRRATL